MNKIFSRGPALNVICVVLFAPFLPIWISSPDGNPTLFSKLVLASFALLYFFFSIKKIPKTLFDIASAIGLPDRSIQSAFYFVSLFFISGLFLDSDRDLASVLGFLLMVGGGGFYLRAYLFVISSK